MMTEQVIADPSDKLVKGSPMKRWHHGGQIVHQKEIILTEDDDSTPHSLYDNLDTSHSMQPTPDFANISEKKVGQG